MHSDHPVAAFCPHCGAYRHEGPCPPPASAPFAPAPSAPRNPLEPAVGQILFGVALLALGLWLMSSWLPPHRPMSSAQAALYLLEGAQQFESRLDHWFFASARIYYGAQLISGLLALLGLGQVIRGATRRRSFETTYCKRCKARVLALRLGRSLRCPNGDHATQPAVRRWLLLALLGMIAAISLLAVIASLGA